jgi:formate hydrogenlyase transcriptional activator
MSDSGEERPRSSATDDRIQLVIDTTPALIHTALPDGSIDYFNQGWLTFLGLPLEEVRGWRWTRAVHAEDREAFVAKWRQALATGEPFEAESRVRRADGQYRWLLHRKVPLRDEGGTIVKWYGSSIDIEDRKQAEERARQQERELRQIVDLVPHHIAVVAPDGTGVYGNQVMLDYYGVTLDDMTMGVIRRFAHPDDVDTFMATWQRGLSGTAAWETEARFQKRDGEYRWFLTRVNPLRDDAGRIVRWYATGTDIDDRKKAEDKVREQERELREILDLVPHHILVTAPDRARLYANHVMLDYYGLTIDDVRSPDFRGMVVHPEDQQAFAASLERGFAGTDPWETEARIRRRDGDYRSFLVRGTPLRDDGGRIVRWYVTGTDIDDRKRAEERIKQDERQLRTIVDFLPQLLVVANARDGIVYANRAALEFAGRTLEETVAHPDVWSELVHPDDLPTMRASMRGLAEGIASELEFRLRRPDGQYRWILSRNAPLPDADGRVIGWFAAGTDIDDRKRAEQRMHDENLALREEVDRASMFEEIVGASPSLRAVLTSVAQVAPTDSTVLITGETGTGKELVARAIHKRSPRAARAFVSVNCAAIPPTLIASELFGHEKGAFTGALQRRAGRFELADRGTIFLDEVGDLPPDTQLALLRVLQEREFERVGSTRPIKVDVRIIAATNRDLQAAIEHDAFRTDLFYRLNVFPIEMPPLRERVSDIPLLVGYFVDRYARQVGKTIRRVDKRTLDLVKSYGWPGNVRELQNVIERAVIICDSGTLTVDPHWLAHDTAKPVRPLGDELTVRERQMIETALAESRGRVSGPTGAAAKLGLHPSTLDSKIRALRIDKHRFKRP